MICAISYILGRIPEPSTILFCSANRGLTWTLTTSLPEAGTGTKRRSLPVSPVRDARNTKARQKVNRGLGKKQEV